MNNLKLRSLFYHSTVFSLFFLNIMGVSLANSPHHIFQTYPFLETELTQDVDVNEFEKAWDTYNFNWRPLELVIEKDGEDTGEKAYATNCREIKAYEKKGWYPDNIRNINLSNSYACACRQLKLLSNTQPLTSEKERRRLRVAPHYDRIVFRTLPYYLTPHTEFLTEEFKGDITVGQLIKRGEVKLEKLPESTIKLSFGGNEVFITEIASARFHESGEIKTLAVVTLHDQGALVFSFSQLFYTDPETGLIFCEEFE